MGWGRPNRHGAIVGIMMLASLSSLAAPRTDAPPSRSDIAAADQEDELPADALRLPLPEGRGGTLETTCGALLGVPFGCFFMAAPCVACPFIATAGGGGTTTTFPQVWDQPSFLAIAALLVLSPMYGVAAPVLLASVGALIAETDPELVFKALLFTLPALLVAAVNVVAISIIIMFTMGTPTVPLTAFNASGLGVLAVLSALLVYFSTGILAAPLTAVGIGIGAQVFMGLGDEKGAPRAGNPDAPPRRRKKKVRPRRRRAVRMTY